jgi:hypothetical protein
VATVDVVMLSAPILLTKETLAVCGSKANWVRWKAMAESEATILLASAGEIPDASQVLNYERCRNEERRQLLIVRRFRGKKTSLADMVACAAKMAAEGSFPGPQGASCRKTEFMRRCVKALKSLDPHAETDMKKLSILDRYAVLVALGEKKELYQGCMTEECQEQETTWNTTDLARPGEPSMPCSRCTRCGQPKAFGRTLFAEDMLYGIMTTPHRRRIQMTLDRQALDRLLRGCI